MAGTIGKFIEKLKKGGSFGFALAVIIFGAMLLLLTSGEKEKSTAPQEVEVTLIAEFSLAETEERIASALSQIDGAGRVMVVLTLKSDGQTFIARDTHLTERGEPQTSDYSLDRSENAVIVGSGGSMQTPVILGRGYPEYRGALVVAEGAANPEVRLQLLGAVSSLTGLGTDKVTVTAMRRLN